MPDNALILAIETSNAPATPGGGQVALLRRSPSGVEPLASRAIGGAPRHDDALMPAIDQLCRSAGVTARDLARVAVSAGPGGYTSVRIAVTTAKLICMAGGAELRVVPTATAVYLGVDESLRGAHPVRILLAWKRGDAWCVDCEANADPRRLGPGRLIAIEAALKSPDTLIVADDTLCQAIGGMHADARLLAAEFSALHVARASELLTGSDPLTAAPIYPREPEAVTKWRELGRGG